MNSDLQNMREWIRICVLVASVGTTLVPVIYAFSPWYKSHLGRAFMLQAVSFSAAIDLTLWFMYWPPDDIRIKFWANAFVFTLIAISTTGLAFMIWKLNYPIRERADMSEPTTHPLLSNATYDKLKFLTVIALPAFAALYLALAGLWDLPSAKEVAGSVTAVNAFFGAILLLSTKAYNNSDAKYDGTIVVSETEDGIKKADLFLKNYENPADVVAQEEVIFKVTQ